MSGERDEEGPSNPLHACGTLVEALRARASLDGPRRAYVFLENGETESASLTFAELDRQARAIAAWLSEEASPGDRALMIYPPGLDFVAAFFGCLYAGVVAVPAFPPMNPRMMGRFDNLVKDAQPRVVLTCAAARSALTAQAKTTAALGDLRWLATDAAEAGRENVWRDPGVGPRDLAFLQYTSGSTSAPKGVMVSHENLLCNERLIETAMGHTRASTFVGWLPLYHDMGLIGNVLQPFYIGALSVLMSPLAFLKRPFRWLQAISKYRGHTAGGPNFGYDFCVRKTTPEQRAELDLSCWKVAYNGAEPIRRRTIESFIETFEPCGFRRESFFPCYGMAEATLFVSGGTVGECPRYVTVNTDALGEHRVESLAADVESGTALVSSGRVWPEMEARIVNPETLEECAANEVGEIWVRGGSVAQGYWRNPEETARCFQARIVPTGEGPFLRTGDLGFIHRGDLVVTGRIKDLIIVGGVNHYPQDIELSVEGCHPALRPTCCAAFAVDGEDEERLVVAQEVEVSKLNGEDLEDVAQRIRQVISEEHQLRVHDIVFLRKGAIPKTSSGKIQRRACRRAYEEGALETIKAMV